jgi:hypothetical protein
MPKKAPPKAVTVEPTEKERLTIDAIKNKRDRADVERLLNERLQLKAAEDEIKRKLSENAEELEPLYAAHSIKTLYHEGKMVILVESAGRATLDKKLLMQGFIKRDVDITIVDEAFKEATKVGKGYTSFQVRNEGEGE